MRAIGWGLLTAAVLAPFWLALNLLASAHTAARPAPESYIPQIAVENLFAGRGTAGEDRGLPIVWFRLRNLGRYTVEEVRVHINFLSADGRIVHEEDFTPVHAGEYGPRSEPLGPGDVWQMSNIRYFMPEHVPHTWQVGNVTARVESLRFADD